VVLAFLFGAGDGGGNYTDLRVCPFFDLTFDGWGSSSESVSTLRCHQPHEKMITEKPAAVSLNWRVPERYSPLVDSDDVVQNCSWWIQYCQR
jgi:hypothetical protein